ncbi:WxcM-like domain-containing protein [Algoriphagus halophilus]|uniref:WxcM-like domain-containing protein n=1 Tax=Algoriphagus halophilus TaxID=226505 RepID=UPI00358E281A
MANKTIWDCNLVYLPKLGDRKGHITPVTNLKELPFETKRVFYLYDIREGKVEEPMPTTSAINF